jgi:Na+-translocating ferredoxin:NAD+ oxidoreductase subunit G
LLKSMFKSVFKGRVRLFGQARAVPGLSLLLIAVFVLATGVGASSASAKDFWTQRDLLAQQFHDSERVSYVRVRPDGAQRAALEARLGRALPKPEYTFFVAQSHGQPDGYALFDEQLGLHEPISFATFFDAEGRVTRVEVVAYREPFGDGVRAERFRKQFVGRGAQSTFRPGEDIDAISGATISSRSLCIGVERAVVLFEATIRNRGAGTLALR